MVVKSGAWSFTVLVVVVLTQWASAWGATPISECPAHINVPGDYILTQNLKCDTVGISIIVSLVNLNLNGHDIEGSGVGVGILAYPSDVHIVGPGTISHFDIGVLVANISNSSIREVTCTKNGTGFQIAQAQKLTIERNIATGNTGDGFFIYSFLSTFSGNVSTLNDGIGFWLSEGTEGNKFEGNISDSNSEGIVSNPGSHGNHIRRNTARNNRSLDLVDDINVVECVNDWAGNIFGAANKPCIH